MDWAPAGQDDYSVNYEGGASALASPNVLYVGDSLFADLVDAKREFGWTTGTYRIAIVNVVLYLVFSFLIRCMNFCIASIATRSCGYT